MIHFNITTHGFSQLNPPQKTQDPQPIFSGKCHSRARANGPDGPDGYGQWT